METERRVLLIDDLEEDALWLVDYLQDQGFAVDQVTNEEAAKAKLAEVRDALRKKPGSYAMAIVDLMIPVMDIMDLIDINDEFFEDSATTGVRLCRYAREELEISAEELPIITLTARSDAEEFWDELESVGVQRLFNRLTQGAEDDLKAYLDQTLPEIG